MMLEYIRKADHVDGGVIPLPEGWHATTHWEPDLAVAKEKIASGRFKKAEKQPAPEGEQPTYDPHHDYGHPHEGEPTALAPVAPVAPATTEVKEG